MERKQPVSVTASDIGQAARCPYALYLEKTGHVPNWQTRLARERGIEQHAQWTCSREPGRICSCWGRVFMIIALVVALAVFLILRL